MPQLAVTLNLDGLDPERVEESCFEFGALAVSYTDQRDDPILEPAPGEFRLWPATRLQALFTGDMDPPHAALAEMVVEGIKTNTALHQEIFTHQAFRTGGQDIHYLERRLGLK